jgi:D-2-hydroxyacid dehydrogenase (NADP+)
MTELLEPQGASDRVLASAMTRQPELGMFTLVISDDDASTYAEPLASDFPNVHVVATSPADLGPPLRTADGLVTFGVELNHALLERAQNLRWIQALSTGTDRFIPLLSNRPNIMLPSARGAHGPAVSEMAIMLMLALARRWPSIVRNQGIRQWMSEVGTLLYQKSVGIAGVGVIGRDIAAHAKAFSMRTVGFGTRIDCFEHLDAVHAYSELRNVVPDLDFLVLTTPLRSDTVGLVNRSIFDQMKSTAYLINVGRGPLVHEEDLVAALQTHRIAGAAMDAHNQEPLPESSPLWTLNNLLITPHVAGVHDRYSEGIIPIIRANLRLMLADRSAELINSVNRAR